MLNSYVYFDVFSVQNIVFQENFFSFFLKKYKMFLKELEETNIDYRNGLY